MFFSSNEVKAPRLMFSAEEHGIPRPADPFLHFPAQNFRPSSFRTAIVSMGVSSLICTFLSGEN